jgi:uncharacterized membrane protein
MAEAPTPTRRRKPRVLTFFCLLAIAGLFSMPLIAGDPADAALTEILKFLGRFHPVLLHLPIGVFVLILLQELGAIFARRAQPHAATSLFPLCFGAASAIAAAIAGFLLYHGDGGDYGGNEIAQRHLWGGLAFAAAAVVTFLAKAWTSALDANPAWYRLLLFASVAVMGFASHDGASLTHGRDYLTQHAPSSLRKLLGLKDGPNSAGPARAADDRVIYTDLIAPILERRCVECHKEGKAKGKFRMDTYELLVKGGKEGPGIEPGNADQSHIVIRMKLPTDDDEHMPPEGKPDVTDTELALIEWWIDQGADPAKTLAESPPPAGLLDSPPAATPRETSGTPDAALQSLVASLSREFPGALAFDPPTSALVSFSTLPLRGNLDDAAFAKLAPLLPHLASLDLSASNITERSIAALAPATRLRLLRLAETGVTDAAVDPLLKLTSLESINFHGTRITDAGAAKLAALPNLKHLYLWQTAVTPQTLQMLKEKLPGCEIIGPAAD